MSDFESLILIDDLHSTGSDQGENIDLELGLEPQLTMLWHHPKNTELDKMKVVHYCAAFFQRSKPWRYNGVEENMEKEDIMMPVNKLRDIYNYETLDYKKNLQQLFAALSEDDTVHFITTHPLLG